MISCVPGGHAPPGILGCNFCTYVPEREIFLIVTIIIISIISIISISEAIRHQKCIFIGPRSPGPIYVSGLSLAETPSVNLTDVTLADKETNLILTEKLIG